MQILRILPFLLVPLCAANAAAQGCTDRRVQAELTEMRGELNGATVGCREAARGDLDGDGAADAVLQLTYEGMGGGNNWGSFVYVLLANRAAPLLEEPEAQRGPVDTITVAGREVRVRTLEYREGDGRCCPSGKDAFAMRVEGRRLVRVPVRGW